MRKILVACAMVAAAACGDASMVASSKSASTSKLPVGIQDPPIPDSEPLPPSAGEVPLAAPPIDDAYVAKQQAYLHALALKEAKWAAEGVTPDDQLELQAKLKSEILGD